MGLIPRLGRSPGGGNSYPSQVALVVKNPPANAGDARDADLVPGSGRPPGGGNGNPLQYSCLENPMEKGRLLGYSPWVGKEWDMTEQLSKNIHTHFSSTRYLVVNREHSVFTMG